MDTSKRETPSARHDVGCQCSGCTQRRPIDDVNCTGYCGRCGRTIDDHTLTREGQAIGCPKR